MKFAEKLYLQVKEKQKEGFHFESIWMTWNTFQLLTKQFKELEMGEVSAKGDMPITKRSWKESKEYQTRTKKERHLEGVKALDLITTLRTLIKIVPPGTVPDGGGPTIKDGNYLLRCVYIGTPEQRATLTEKVRKFNIKANKEYKEDFGKKIARKVA